MSRNTWDDRTMPGVIPEQGGPAWLRPASVPPSPPPPAPPPPSPAASPLGATVGQSFSARPWSNDPSEQPVYHHVAHDRNAGRAGAIAASNAAADSVPPRTDSRLIAKVAPATCEPFQVLWVDSQRMSAVRGLGTDQAGDPDEWVGADEIAVVAGSNGDPARARAASMLGEQPNTDVGDLYPLLAASVGRSGELEPTFCVTRGELVLPLCDVERLRALHTALEPLAPMDKRLQDSCNHAKDILGRKIVAPEAIDIATRRLLEAHNATGRPAGDIELTMDQSLLRARAFQKRPVFGESHVRALFSQGGRGVPVYLREDATAVLPLCQRVRVALLAEVSPSQDETETFGLCLRPVAVGRIVQLRG